MEDAPPVLYSVDDGVAHIELNRPDSYNAFNVALNGALEEAFRRAGEDASVGAVLLSGHGRAFSGGGDVKAMAVPDPAVIVAELAESSHRALRVMAELDKPIVAAVHRSVAGAGLAFTCAADLVLAGESTRFLSAFIGIGVSPDTGASWLLPRVVGMRRALELTMLNRVLTAAEALDWGLITAIHPDEEVLDAGRALARRLAAGPSVALGRTRRLVRDAAERSLDDHLDVEAASITELIATDDSVALVHAFANR